MTVAVPTVFVGTVLIGAVAMRPYAEVMGRATSSSAAAALVIAAVLTIATVARQRREAASTPPPWSPDVLVGSEPRSWQDLVRLVAALTMAGLIVAALVGQATGGALLSPSGQALPIIDPALWSFWMPYFIALLLVQAARQIAVYARPSQLRLWAWANLPIQAAFCIPAIWLLVTGRLLNPAITTTLGPEADRVVGAAAPALAALILAIVLIDNSGELWRAYRKGNRTTA